MLSIGEAKQNHPTTMRNYNPIVLGVLSGKPHCFLLEYLRSRSTSHDFGFSIMHHPSNLQPLMLNLIIFIWKQLQALHYKFVSCNDASSFISKYLHQCTGWPSQHIQPRGLLTWKLWSSKESKSRPHFKAFCLILPSRTLWSICSPKHCNLDFEMFYSDHQTWKKEKKRAC